MTLRRYCLRGVFRFYPLQSLQPYMPSYHNRYRKARWYLVRIPTDVVATNTSGHYLIQVPRPHRNEWINWRKPVSVANSQAIMAVVLSFSATLPKPKPYLRKNDRMLSSLIKRGRQNRFLLLQHIILLSKKMFDTPQSPLVRQKHCNDVSNMIHDLINVK